MTEHVFKIIFLAVIIFTLNLPFGYWRANVRKFSFKWFLFIHLPIPVIIFLRIFSHVGFAFYTYPIFIGAFIMGQFIGKKLSQQSAGPNSQSFDGSF